MHDDIRPSYKSGHSSSGSQDIEELDEVSFDDSLPDPEPETPPEQEVNEKELEKEFGPPPPENEDNQMTQSDKDKPEKKSKIPRKFGKRQIFTLVGILVILAGSAGIYWQVGRSHITGGTVKISQAPIKPKTVASTLSGLQVDPSVNDRPVTGVMIENSPDARPQSGLSDAGVVFEAIAEGGITRFLALFQDGQPSNIGPVRSARPYFIKWCLSFDCSYAHVGGSPEALQDIKTWGVKDLDQFFNAGAYHRVSTRYAPHNMYTNINALNSLEKGKGFGKSSFVGFARKKDTPSKTPTASTINMAISGGDYDTAYTYNPTTNNYSRSEGGAPHIDANTGKQLTPKVLLVLIMDYGLESDNHHSTYANVGTGQLLVFQDGTVQKGTWSKADTKAQLNLSDENGHPLKLNAGQTWITALPSESQVTYK